MGHASGLLDLMVDMSFFVLYVVGGGSIFFFYNAKRKKSHFEISVQSGRQGA